MICDGFDLESVANCWSGPARWAWGRHWAGAKLLKFALLSSKFVANLGRGVGWGGQGGWGGVGWGGVGQVDWIVEDSAGHKQACAMPKTKCLLDWPISCAKKP